MYFEFGPPFLSKKTTIILDVLFLVCSVIYLVVDWVDVPSIKFLLAVKPIPVFLMITQVWPVRSYHPAVLKMAIGLAWGSLGDILLLVRSLFEGTTQEMLFNAGALAFLVGHFFYVLAFLQAAESIAQGKVQLQSVLAPKIFFMLIWLVLVSMSFYIISGLMQHIPPDSIKNYILPVYGTFLLMLVMGALFFFFLVKGVSKLSLLAGILILVGSVLFFISDNLLAQGQFGDQTFRTKYAKEISLWLMITYYLAQFGLGRGAVTIAAYFDNRQGQELKSLSGI